MEFREVPHKRLKESANDTLYLMINNVLLCDGHVVASEATRSFLSRVTFLALYASWKPYSPEMV